MISHGKEATPADCKLELVCDLLHVPLPQGHRHEVGKCFTLADLCSSGNYMGTQVIFATHLSTAMTAKRSKMPQHHVFGKLGYLPADESDKLTDLRQAAVICVNATKNYYLLHEAYAATVRSTPPRKARKRESCLPVAGPPPPKKKKKQVLDEEKVEDECRCKQCVDSVKYKDNVGGFKQQQLFRSTDGHPGADAGPGHVGRGVGGRRQEVFEALSVFLGLGELHRRQVGPR